MFIFRYPRHNKLLDKLYEQAMKQADGYFYSTSHYNTTPTADEDDDIMEQSSTQIKYILDFPGISPERVSVKLTADRKAILIHVDGSLQRSVVAPPAIKPDDISVKMEHGRLTLMISRQVQAATKEDEVSIPINGKQFLQE